ncbi:MAG: CpsD/CapB family tyrosine-protein kinase [Alphaproteobacteria bacterium]
MHRPVDTGHYRELSPVFTETQVVPVDRKVMAREYIMSGGTEGAKGAVYRALRAQVLQWLTKAGKRSVAIASVGPREGRTLTAINLAIAIAMDVNQTSLLVDADLRKPDIHKRFGIEPAHGLEDYLSGAVPLASCLINPSIDRLVILPTRKPMENSAELLASPRMTALTKELRDRYRDRVIIYDTPPLTSGGDAIGFLPNVESVLLVVRDGAVRSGEMETALELLRDRSVIGTVLNAEV